MSQKGFIPIIFIIALLTISAGIIGGSVYLKNNYSSFLLKKSSSSNVVVSNFIPQPIATSTTGIPAKENSNASSIPLLQRPENISKAVSVVSSTATPSSADSPTPKFDNGEMSSDAYNQGLLAEIATQVNQYYLNYGKKPRSLSELDFSSIKGITRAEAFIKKVRYYLRDFEYYDLCAPFENEIPELGSIFFEFKKDKYSVLPVDLPANYQCFTLATFRKSGYQMTARPTVYPKYEGAKVMVEDKIDKVTHDAIYTLNQYDAVYTLIDKSDSGIQRPQGFTPVANKETGHFHFPYGFFNDIADEWGLIGNRGGSFGDKEGPPVTVKVTFKQPIKLAKISLLFSDCLVYDCYKWSAIGITPENVTINLANISQTGLNNKIYSTQEIVSNEQFKEVDIAVTRIEFTYEYTIIWKKIKFEYK